jgi:hypothetical protein
MDKNFFKSALVVAMLGLTACSSEPAKTTEGKTDTEAAKKAPAGPPEPVTGKTAFYEMYTPARAWAADILPISLKSGEVKGVKNADGKAGVWTAVFGSVMLRSSRRYTYAVAEELPGIYKGVKAESPDSWAGPTTAVMTFQNSDFVIDSDAAYKAAADKAGDWLKDKENADKPVSLSLGAATRFPAPVWYVLFGNTKSGFYAYVNATTGNIIAK